MSSSLYSVKLLLALACLGLSIFVIVKGQSCIDRMKSAGATQQEQPGGNTADLLHQLQQKEDGLITMQKALEKQQTDTQTEMQSKQAEINRGTQVTQLYSSLLKDMATLAFNPTTGAVKNEKLKDLLARNGITISVAPTPAPAK